MNSYAYCDRSKYSMCIHACALPHPSRIAVIVLTGHVLRRLDVSNMTHHRSPVRGDDYVLKSGAQWRKNGYYHLHFGLIE